MDIHLQQSVINPVVRPAWNLGIPIPGDALLETTGIELASRVGHNGGHGF